MAKHVKRPVLPIYLIGVTWLVYALLFPLHTVMQFITCAVASLVVFVIAKAVFPDKTYEIPGEPEPEKKEQTTGNPEIDALIKERDRALSEMRRLNENIPDEKISAQIDHLEEVTRKIIDHVAANPKKLPQIRRFMDYYLPTTLKILNAYDRMDSTGISGENIDSTKQRVERMMDTLVLAFDKQLDSLFGAEAMDISTDITVLENLLAQEGLNGSDFKRTEQSGEEKPGEDGITLQL